MSNYKIIITDRAINDLINIGDYITYTLLEPRIALNLVKEIRESIYKLRVFPFRQTLVNDEVLAEQGIRCLPYKNYYIFYIVEADRDDVLIIRIGYNKRNWKQILGI